MKNACHFFKNILTLTIFITCFCIVNGQEINDNFDNGNTAGWTEGTVGDWISSTDTPITATHSLKHNLNSISSTSYIYHPTSSLNMNSQDIVWQFNLKNGNWDPSGANKFWVYLTANESDLTSSTVDGYAIGVNFSGSSDLLTLWKVTDGTVDVAIITTPLDWNANVTTGIRVTRSSAGLWKVVTDADGNFDNLISQGTASNTDYTFANYFGVAFTFSATRAGLLWLDDVFVEGTAPSTEPTVSFSSNSSIQTETNATFNTTIPVTLSNYDANVTLSVTIDSESTAEPADYSLNTSSLSFTADGSQNISLDINDDIDFTSETIILNLTVNTGTATINIEQHTLTVIDDDLPIVINEIHADPDATNGDANGDGDVDTTDDEFIEIYNISGGDLDVSGWIIADAVNDRHTFPNGTIIPTDESIVVFGGGIPIMVPGLVEVASSGTLGLNNGGDTIIIKDAADIVIIEETYGSNAGSNQSIAREDDFTGLFAQHSSIVSNPVLFSPGRDNTNNTAFSSTVKWTGATSNDWNTATNWLDTMLPIATSNIIIPSRLTNYPTASSAITFNTLIIESGATFIAQNTVTGAVTYKKNVPTNNWYLISSPVAGETIENIIANHTLATGTGSNLGLAPFNNNSLTNTWDYQTATATGTIDGQGYSIKLAIAGDISFTGTINTAVVEMGIVNGARDSFNLIGNPFTSYINSDTFVSNSANTLVLAEETIWLWDGFQYITYNAMSPTEIAPGQGFFVQAASNGQTIFETSNQSHYFSDTITKQEPISNFELFVESGDEKNATKVFYVADKTTGFDNGYDSKMFGGTVYDFAIFTELVSENEGKKLAIQTLPNENFETMVIPVGIIAPAGKEITFSVTSENFPENISIFLEDSINNEFVNLSESEYKTTLVEASDSTGQFYIHTTSQKLSTNDFTQNFTDISIYKSAKQELTITGLQYDTQITLFSILGKKIFTEEIISNGNNKITFPSLSSGVYIIELASKNSTVRQKIILD